MWTSQKPPNYRLQLTSPVPRSDVEAPFAGPRPWRRLGTSRARGLRPRTLGVRALQLGPGFVRPTCGPLDLARRGRIHMKYISQRPDGSFDLTEYERYLD